ncbi:MAG TPA: hypothetical protein P5138_01935, partial [Solirubrobacterales bacterium]|nr:hypothetical protein [Solirubrobacterales bacterium]
LLHPQQMDQRAQKLHPARPAAEGFGAATLCGCTTRGWRRYPQRASNFQTRFSTPGVGAGSGVTNRVRAGWIVMPVSAGTRTFQLRYATTGGTAIFKNRVLRVAVIR